MKLKVGDIYFWTWKGDRHKETYAYHCSSRYAVVNEDGVLVDTYFYGISSSNTILKPEDVELDFLGHPDEMTVIQKYDVNYYNQQSIVDLRHPNNSCGPIYLKNGAQKDTNKMSGILIDRIKKEKFEIEASIRSLQSLERKLLLMEQDKIEEVYL